MKSDLINDIRPGLMIAGAVLLFGIIMGIVFGIFEDSVKALVSAGVDANLAAHLNDPDAKAKIFRWWQRSHFHATGIGAFTLALISVTAITNLRPKVKRLCSILIGMGGLYAISWFVMALNAPYVGRHDAHFLFSVKALVYLGVGSLLTGLGILFSSIIFEWFSDIS